MTYYQTDPETGEFIDGPFEAREDPRTEGHFLIPRGGVLDAPPVVEDGYVAAWRDAEWKALEDHRGEIGWVNGELYTVKDLGPYPEGWSDSPPPEPAPDPAAIIVSPRQIRLALLGQGITPQMVADLLSEDPAAMVEWEYATYVERSHPLVDSLAEAFELDSEDVDALFLTAASL